MAEVTPPPPPPSSGLPAQPAPPPTVTVTNPPPPALLELPLGARLEAVIAAITGQGRVDIDTAVGRLSLATGFPLPKDGPLTLQLLAKVPAPQFLITAVHGLRPETALRALGLANAAGQAAAGLASGRVAGAQSGQGGGPAVAAQAAPPAAINLTVGATLTATLLRPGPPVISAAAPVAAGQATPPAGGPALPGAATPAGNPLLAAQAQTATARPGAGIPAAAAPASTPTGGQPSAPAADPAAGTRFAIRVVSFQPLADGEAPPPLRAGPPLAPGNTLAGVVTGSAQPSGHPVVQTAAGSLIVATRTPLPPGSTVVFEVLSQTAPPPAQHPGGHGAIPPLGDAGWPALQETLAALEEINPGIAQQLAQAVLPRPGAALGANLLFFLVALAGGDLRNWIGDGPNRILQRFRPELLSRLGDDFGRIARVADDRGPGDWRTYLLPFFNGAEIQPIRLYTRPAGDDEETEKGRKGTRFVVDITYSHFGRLQLDGLVYQKEKHMDLIVRTEKRLPEKVENGIRGIFEDANETTGIKGGIGFQAAPPNFVEVDRPERPTEHVGLIV